MIESACMREPFFLDDYDPFYLWQTEYRLPHKIELDKPADVLCDTAMPCTPRGDFICTLNRAEDVVKLFPLLKGKSAAEAIEIARTLPRNMISAVGEISPQFGISRTMHRVW